MFSLFCVYMFVEFCGFIVIYLFFFEKSFIVKFDYGGYGIFGRLKMHLHMNELSTVVLFLYLAIYLVKLVSSV